MADIEIIIDPIPQGEPFSFSAVLDGSVYRFDCRYWPRLQRWLINSYYELDKPLMMSIPGEVNYPLFKDCASPYRPLGELVLVDISGKGLAPGPNDMGERVKWIYRPLADL